LCIECISYRYIALETRKVYKPREMLKKGQHIGETMKTIFLLSGEQPDLAREEVLALAGTEDYWQFENVLVADTDFRYDRLAFTRKVYKHLFECSYKDLASEMDKFDWKSVYKKNFSIRIVNIKDARLEEKEAELAKYIWRQVQEPRVDLKEAVTKIEIIVTEEKIFAGLVLKEIAQDFWSRRPCTRPETHPTTLAPKLARACVNLTGIPVGKVLCDPFCGTGGILIEAGLMRFNTLGFDISSKMLLKCEKNLDFFGIKRFRLEKMDATSIRQNLDYVVSDLPYGKGSYASKEVNSLYLDFLKNLQGVLRHKAVIIFPDMVDHRKIIKQTDFAI
jgi:tRNA (guanine10-N2)-dimethyltransferase